MLKYVQLNYEEGKMEKEKKQARKSILIQVFLSMLKIGAFTFGGGYAMIPLMENEFTTKRKWIEREEFLDIVAIAESTPGPIAINAATYIGYKAAGICGAALGTLGVALPSLLIIYAISLFFDEFLSITYVGYAFRGIQVAVIYLMLTAGIKMFKSIKKTAFNLVIAFTVFAGMTAVSIFAVNFSSITTILLSGMIGVFIYLIGFIKNRTRGADNK